MMVYVFIYIKCYKCIQGLCVINMMRNRIRTCQANKMGTTKNSVNMDDKHGESPIPIEVGLNSPHPSFRARMFTNGREYGDEGTRVLDIVEVNLKEKLNLSHK